MQCRKLSEQMQQMWIGRVEEKLCHRLDNVGELTLLILLFSVIIMHFLEIVGNCNCCESIWRRR